MDQGTGTQTSMSRHRQTRTQRTRTRSTLVGLAVAAGLAWSATSVSAEPTVWWSQDFSGGTSGWYDSTSGWFGAITHNPDTQTATVTGGTFHIGPYSAFDGYRDEWPGDYVAELSVYLDPSWPVGTGFDYNVSTANSNYFAVQVAVDEAGLWVGASDQFSYSVRPRTTPSADVAVAGWYTLRHTFRDVEGVLTVTVTVLDSGAQVVMEHTMANPDLALVGNGLSWFSFVTVPGGVTIDDHRLFPYVPPSPPAGPQSKDDCTKNGWTDFGFKNQGQCVASVVAAPKGKK